MHRNEFGDDLACSCPVCRDNNLTDLELELGERLTDGFHVHEVFAQNYTAQEVRRQMTSKYGLKKYFSTRKYASKPLSEVFSLSMSSEQTTFGVKEPFA